jgi:hypothetical protein
MSISTIIIVNALAASLLVVILTALMLAPSRLRRPFAEGHTPRQKSALHAQRRAEAAQRRRHRQREHEPAWRPIQDV